MKAERRAPHEQGKLQPIFPKKIKPPTQQVSEVNEEADKEQEGWQDEQDATNYTREQKNEQLEKLHRHIDWQIKYAHNKLVKLLKSQNTEEYLTTFSECIETATANFATTQQKRLQGRSTINIALVHDQKPARFHVETHEMEKPVHAEDASILKQFRRLQAIKQCVQKCGKTCGFDGKQPKLEHEIRANIQKFLKDARKHDSIVLQDHLRQACAGGSLSFFALAKAVKVMQADLASYRRAVKDASGQTRKRNF